MTTKKQFNGCKKVFDSATLIHELKLQNFIAMKIQVKNLLNGFKKFTLVHPQPCPGPTAKCGRYTFYL